ncbi:putative SprA-related family protein [Campylobacter hyointestinalis subsp. hyointestinalis LMG 9260]|uniref:putative metalloprotease CJM1_0395 family protein n=1 Tax=Campylobacter hyointestinalis TaxID=198 RepID=UPI0007C8DA9A|nr:putative metalloprotease CJM1_0395 family protein [Campylobacter hyointestinalis]ANE32706.1 putative SprA-related family protein [Campylobacter hyointestinalis subsp. hyointestinalis LMG 9260]SUW88865.1 SrpA-related protein [Campylobacter hyointestinalis]
MIIGNSFSTTSPYLDYGTKNSSDKEDTVKTSQTSDDSSSKNDNKDKKNITQLSDEEKLQVAKLQQRDSEVRTHEASHMAAGAGLTSGADFTYQKGPDSKMYAVGGEVGIDTSPGKTPEETIQKAQQIKRAALAPSSPSPADLKIAANAASMEVSAKAQMQQVQQDSNNNQSNGSTNSNSKNSTKNPYEQNTYIPTVIGLF